MPFPLARGHGKPVPSHRRNPRRAYDEEGREFTAMTLQQAIERGVQALRAVCDCGHTEVLPMRVGNWPAASFVPDAGMTLRCSACSKPDPQTEPVWPRRKA